MAKHVVNYSLTPRVALSTSSGILGTGFPDTDLTQPTFQLQNSYARSRKIEEITHSEPFVSGAVQRADISYLLPYLILINHSDRRNHYCSHVAHEESEE